MATGTFSHDYIETATGVNRNGQRRLGLKAADRGFDPRVSMRIYEHYVTDGARTGRPRKNKNAKDVEVFRLGNEDEPLNGDLDINAESS